MARTRKTKPTQPHDHRPVARQPPQVRPRHHAQGQGAERRPRPPAAAHLDHVPQVPRRPGAAARGGGRARRQEVPPRHRTALPLARLGRQPAGHHRRRTARLHQPGRMHPPRRQARPRPVRLPARPDQRQRRRPPRRDRHRLPGRRQPHDERLPAARRDQQGRRHPLHLQRRAAHPGRALRIHAARDARRRRRLRRVLHPARRSCASWSRSPTRASARPCSTRPAAPAASWSRRSTTSSKQVKTVADRKILQERSHLRRRAEVAALPALPDEPAAARARRARRSTPATRCASS